MADEKEPTPTEMEVRLNFRIPPRTPSFYAHQMYIQQGQNEVVLSFFEVIPPVMLEPPNEERVKAILEVGLLAECVARVTVAKGSFPAFAKAMQTVANQLATPEVQEPQHADDIRDSPKG